MARSWTGRKAPRERSVYVQCLSPFRSSHQLFPQSFIDPGLSWDDIPWFKSITKSPLRFLQISPYYIISRTAPAVPIILKGVQTWEVRLSIWPMRLTLWLTLSSQDTVKAIDAGCQGVVLSNHGGRQLDFARSGIEVLVEVVDKLKELGRWPVPNFEIYLDGGVRRATDVLKAVALGATAGARVRTCTDSAQTHQFGSCSGCRSTVHLRVLCIRTRGRRARAADPPRGCLTLRNCRRHPHI